ncbi:hypothetical protein VTN96DRAFT_2504 [Rasamsonia emersonii]|uniref:Mediator of RNA polymerase II transcription subunit 18 n=1 Tax=Rasamsonia emersonii (strain ATCC 16479 / CBS 393.64 / IMI 116815) TaxID=1408163 RepID=A0A0F4YTE5_RASE3|nr:Mediator of RNA polymerase II transcription subunit 18 [Rasamsonia emersonii CBS 393.64]KKA21514.1 Mediator of RNA polymerase II transcription subunit 18 [Rasamsonia emersonii CBS 393.64]
MHELLLFASVPEHQHHELLQQLAGLTAMQPRHRLERHLVFKAHRPPGRADTRVGGSQELQGSEVQRLSKMLTGVLFYTKVVGPVAESDFGAPPFSISTPQGYDFDSQPWRLEFRDIPEAGTRTPVTARLMANASLPQGDVIPPMDAWGYSFVTEYVVEGDVFIYNDIVLFLHRVLNFPADNHDPRVPRRSLPPLEKMSLLDQSGSYVLQAAVTVQDGSNQETMKIATQQLFNLKDQLKTAVKLEPADRLSLDTRVK